MFRVLSTVAAIALTSTQAINLEGRPFDGNDMITLQSHTKIIDTIIKTAKSRGDMTEEVESAIQK